MTTISSLWVTKNGNPIPSSQETHGLRNMMQIAKKYPNDKINIYVDDLSNTLQYSLRPNETLPNNLHFIPVQRLINECKRKRENYFKAKLVEQGINNIDPLKFKEVVAEKLQIIDDAYNLYKLELEHGAAAYAGNFIKIIAAYANEGFVIDIGVQYNKDTFSVMENIYSDNFSLSRPFVAIWSGANSNEATYDTIIKFTEAYKNKALSFYYTVIKDIELSFLPKERKEAIIEDIKKIKYEYPNNMVFFIRTCTYLMNNVPEKFFKYQDTIYANSLNSGRANVSPNLLPLTYIHHQQSHLGVHQDGWIVTENNKKIERTVATDLLRRNISTPVRRSTSARGYIKNKIIVRASTPTK